MAAELDMSNDRVNFAFTGDRNLIWHGLGQQIQEDATLEEWKVAAGMEWEAKESPILFNDGNDMPTIFPNRKALFRSDTNFPLSVVGSDYKIVNPGQILEFFEELLERHDMKMSTAGVLFNGRRFFATAELGKNFEVINGDKISGFMLLATSLDGSLATTGKITSVRTVCNNTLTMAMNEKTKNMVKVSHATEFDAKRAKIDLGLAEDVQMVFIENMRKLAQATCSDSDAKKFYQDLYYNKDVPADEQHGTIVKKVNEMFNLYKFGNGANFHNGSLYGVLQGVTDYYDHSTKSRTDSARFWNQFYTSDKPKLEAQTKLLQMVA